MKVQREKTIEEYETRYKKDKITKFILVLIIFVLIIIYLVSFRIGVISDLGGIKQDYLEKNNESIEDEKDNKNEISKTDKKPTKYDYSINSEFNTVDNNFETNDSPINKNPNSKENPDENDNFKEEDKYEDDKEDDDVTSDEIKLVKISWNGKEVNKNTKLDIFKNEKFNGQKIISPNSKGSSSFCVENTSNSDMICNMKFIEESEGDVNMKYRLKIDNKYIVGNDNKYESIEKLNLKDIILPKKTINMYTIDWYWEDNDQTDTIAGTSKDKQQYTLNFEIFAEEYIK